MATRYECDGCGVAACDLPDGVDPDEVFLKVPEGQVLCQGCIMAVQQGSGTWSAPIRGDLPAYHDWEGDPIVVGDRPRTAADYVRDSRAGGISGWTEESSPSVVSFPPGAVCPGVPARSVEGPTA